MATANYYRLFSLQPSATPIDIKRRYRQLSLMYHPDRGGSIEKMALINEAYSVLSNGFKRHEYDQQYAAAQQAAQRVSTFEDVVRPRENYAFTPDGPYQSVRRQQTAEFYRHSSFRQRPERRSYFWEWIVATGMVAFVFLAYQLYSVTQSPAVTASGLPDTGLVNPETRSATNRAQNNYRNDSTQINFQ